MRVFFESPLDLHQLKSLRNWVRPKHSFSDHAFGGSPYKKRVTLPLKLPKSPTAPRVAEALAKHGYKLHDYHAGLAKDKHGRDVKVGKVLTKAGEHDALHLYNTDPHRASATHSHLQVVISRKASDVAGMSTNTPWKSCMTMGHSNCGYLPDDVKHGTHVAYLVKRGDHKARSPLARIALKPHFAANDGSPPVLRSENIVYGNAPPAFKSTVASWAKKHFKPTEIHYEKHPDLYNDDGARHLVNHGKVRKLIKDVTSGWHKDQLTSDQSSAVLAASSRVSKKNLRVLSTNPLINSSVRDQLRQKKMLGRKYYNDVVHRAINNPESSAARSDADDVMYRHSNNITQKTALAGLKQGLVAGHAIRSIPGRTLTKAYLTGNIHPSIIPDLTSRLALSKGAYRRFKKAGSSLVHPSMIFGSQADVVDAVKKSKAGSSAHSSALYHSYVHGRAPDKRPLRNTLAKHVLTLPGGHAGVGAFDKYTGSYHHPSVSAKFLRTLNYGNATPISAGKISGHIHNVAGHVSKQTFTKLLNNAIHIAATHPHAETRTHMTLGLAAASSKEHAMAMGHDPKGSVFKHIDDHIYPAVRKHVIAHLKAEKEPTMASVKLRHIKSRNELFGDLTTDHLNA